MATHQALLCQPTRTHPEVRPRRPSLVTFARVGAFATFLGCGVAALAQEPFLVRDIAAGDPFPNPVGFFSRGLFHQVGDLLCVGWDDGIHGIEPWCTDGTTEGTYLLKDICPGACSSTQMYEGATRAGVLYFPAEDEAHGEELWKTDGTAAGTVLVADLVPGPRPSSPRGMTAVADAVVFSAQTPDAGAELWRTDGTAAGTALVVDLAPGAADSRPDSFFPHAGKAFFNAYAPPYCGVGTCPGGSLWVTDGTAAGTLPLGVSPEGSQPGIPWATLGELVFFAAQASDWTLQPWVSDGTPSGTHRIDPDRSINVYTGFRAMGDAVYFGAESSTSFGADLWRIDGTAGGTQRVAEGLNPGGFAALGDCLLFQASQPDSGHELWASDGTTAGTALLKDTRPGPESGLAYELWLVGGWLMVPAGDHVFFWADDGVHGGELWRTDCTPDGTLPIGDLLPGPGTSLNIPPFATARGDELFFGALDEKWRTDLWKAAGTPGSAARLRRIDPFVSSRPKELASTSLGLLLAAGTDANGWRLFHSDGTAQGTFEMQTADGDPVLWPEGMTEIGDTVYFRAWTAATGIEPWQLRDGALSLLQDLQPGQNSSYPGQFVRLPAAVVFASDRGVVKVVESPHGAVLLSDQPLNAYEPVPTRDGIAYFTGYSGLWRTDGTAPGTFALASDLGLMEVESPLRVGVAVYFIARDPEHGRELWRVDADETVHLVVDLAPGPADGVAGRYHFLAQSGLSLTGRRRPPSSLIAAGGSLYFSGNDGTHGWEPWRSDGTATGTTMVADLAPGTASSEPAHFAATCGRLYFAADHPTLGRTLWKSDGTAAGTLPAAPAAPPWNHPTLPDELTPWGERLFFTAHTPAAGRELWMTLNGRTRRVADIAPGPLPSTPNWLTVHDGRLYFAANDGTTGFELWALDAPYLPCGGAQIFADGFESGTTDAWMTP